MPAADSQISHYRVLDRLGAGGMGEVLRALDPRIGRHVAIKLLPAASGDDADRQLRLLREAQAAGGLNHPGIVTVHDVGLHDGRPYVVMELVEGERFTQLAGHVSLAEALRMCADVAGALAAAHARGILHRDVKSDNLMRTPDGRVKVLDFGLAKLAEPGPSLDSLDGTLPATVSSSGTRTLRPTAPPPGQHVDDSVAYLATMTPSPSTRTGDVTIAGALLGTPAYMAPEQARGEPITARSEVFSLGVVLYELVCGKRPFTGGSIDELLAAVQAARYEPPSRVASVRIPRFVEIVLGKALAREPGARYPTMAELAHELRDSAELLAPKKRGPLFLTGLAVVGTAPIAVGLYFMLRDAHPAAAPIATDDAGVPTLDPERLSLARVERVTAQEGCEEFPSFTPDGRALVYDGPVPDGSAIFLIDLTTRTPRQLTLGLGWEFAGAMSPDGTHVAFVRSADKVTAVVMPLATGQERTLVSGGVRPKWTADGRLWAGSPEQPGLYAATGGPPVRKLVLPAHHRVYNLVETERGVLGIPMTDEQSQAQGLAWLGATPDELTWAVLDQFEEAIARDVDGSVLASRVVAGGTTDLVRVHPGGEVTTVIAPEIDARQGLAISPDGARIAWSTCREHFDLATVERSSRGGAKIVRMIGGDWAEGMPTGLPGGAGYIVASDRVNDYELWHVDPYSGAPPRALRSGPVRQSGLAVSPDGTHVAFAGTGDRDGLHLIAIATGEMTKLTDNAADTFPAFSADGRRLYFSREIADATYVMVTPIAGGAPEQVALGQTPLALGDGRLVYCDATRGVVVRDAKTDATRRLTDAIPVGYCKAIALSQDGRELAVISGENKLFVVDAKTGAVRTRAETGADGLTGVTWIGNQLVVARTRWEGDLFLAERTPSK